MSTISGLVADAARFRDMAESLRILDFLEDYFRGLGARHVLVTGLPLPGRPIEPLVLRINWGDLRGDRPSAAPINPRDPVLKFALGTQSVRRFGAAQGNPPVPIDSALAALAGCPTTLDLLCVPIGAFPPYQGCVLAAGEPLVMDDNTLFALGYFCAAAFRQLFALGLLQPNRPGDLSARERSVLELTARGKTASQIASLLEISQRTVHAHLQNASEKMRASNKTQTVVEALRYGQISI
jgi:LuxR family transcriptional regulator, quorum-sensing system regulator BjaR1